MELAAESPLDVPSMGEAAAQKRFDRRDLRRQCGTRFRDVEGGSCGEQVSNYAELHGESAYEHFLILCARVEGAREVAPVGVAARALVHCRHAPGPAEHEYFAAGYPRAFGAA